MLAVTRQILAALVAVPGLRWLLVIPGARKIIEFIIQKIVGWLVQETSVGASILWIQVEMAYEIKSAEDAARKLQEILANPTRYTEAQQKEIEAHFDESTVNLIQLGVKRLS